MDRSRDDAGRLWAAALELHRGLAGRAGGVTLPPLWFVTDPERTSRPWEIAARLPEGAGVIHRAFGAADAVETGRRIREVLKGPLLAGLDPALAEAISADGVHLPERALGQAMVIRDAHPGWLITGAVHAGADPEAAPGLDAVLVSPVFPAGGSSSGKTALGIDGFRRIAARLSCPAYALGGIGPDEAERLIGSSACGIAAVDAITRAFGPD